MIKNKIVLVPFPFDNLTTAKVRPAVCLTNKIGPHNHVVLAFITSQVPVDLMETDIVVDSDNKDFQKTGLKVSSTIRLHRLMTISTSIIRRELGQLSKDHQAQIDRRLIKLFQLQGKI